MGKVKESGIMSQESIDLMNEFIEFSTSIDTETFTCNFDKQSKLEIEKNQMNNRVILSTGGDLVFLSKNDACKLLLSLATLIKGLK